MHLHQDIAEQGRHINSVEERVNTLEEAQAQCRATCSLLQMENKQMKAKIEDLENRSRRNNLRLVGVPELVPTRDLVALCEKDMPIALQMSAACKVEKAGATTSRPAKGRIAKTCSPGPKAKTSYSPLSGLLRQSFDPASLQKNEKKTLEIGGSRILLVEDFSVDVAKCRREFSPLCSSLYQEQLTFALIYPALKMYTPDGQLFTFQDPKVAHRDLQQFIPKI